MTTQNPLSLDSFEVFPWSKNFEIGIPHLDEQHQQLVRLLNQLTEALIHDDTPTHSQIFDELTRYAKQHFDSEESTWAPHFGDDPWFRKHEASHRDFLPRVQALQKLHDDKSPREITEAIVKFLIRWLAAHIIDSDRRMALVVEKMKAGASLKEAKTRTEGEMRNTSQILTDTVLVMYDELSSRTLALMRERVERQKAEAQLSEANRELKRLSNTDALTGLYNRRYFTEVFERELRRAQRDQTYLSLLMFDIDYFKRLNDHYGHVAGDNALQKIGDQLNQLCQRAGDYAFRLGGEEFGVVIADRSLASGFEFAKKIRGAIEALQIPNVNSEIADVVTVSIGVITRRPTPEDSVESFMRESDHRLYRAKSEGRNLVITDPA